MSKQTSALTSLTLTEVHDLAVRVLVHHGCDQVNADATAANMTAAEADGCPSHGLFRLAGHVASLDSGKVNGTSAPTVDQVAPSVIRVDGDGGFAPYAHQIGRDPLIAAARVTGMASMAISRTHHFAALWPEAQMLASEGLVAMAFVSSVPFVAPAGGTNKFFGTNPMAFAWPRVGKPPMVWDQASSAMARGEIQLAQRDGHAIGDGVGIDSSGAPTTDPAEILSGAQLTFGGYKGSAIALMVDLLAGPLLGEVSSVEAGEADNGDGGPSTGGQLILAFDPARFGGADPIARGERVFEGMLAQEGVRLPGDRRVANRERTATEGITIPNSLRDEIAALLS